MPLHLCGSTLHTVNPVMVMTTCDSANLLLSLLYELSNTHMLRHAASTKSTNTTKLANKLTLFTQ